MEERADLRNHLLTCDIDIESGDCLEQLIDYGLEMSDREVLERFLVSASVQNRGIALDGLITYLDIVGYESDVLLLHLDGIDSGEIADIVGVRLLLTLAAKGAAQAVRSLVNLSRREGWLENYTLPEATREAFLQRLLRSSS